MRDGEELETHPRGAGGADVAVAPRGRRPGEVPDDDPEPGETPPGIPDPDGPREPGEGDDAPDGPVPDAPARPGQPGEPADPGERDDGDGRGAPGEPLESTWAQPQRRYPAQERPRDRARPDDETHDREGRRRAG